MQDSRVMVSINVNKSTLAVMHKALRIRVGALAILAEGGEFESRLLLESSYQSALEALHTIELVCIDRIEQSRIMSLAQSGYDHLRAALSAQQVVFQLLLCDRFPVSASLIEMLSMTRLALSTVEQVRPKLVGIALAREACSSALDQLRGIEETVALHAENPEAGVIVEQLSG